MKHLLKNTIELFRNHSLLFLYSLVIALLLYGIIHASGVKYLHFIAIFVASLYISYFAFFKFGLGSYISKIQNSISGRIIKDSTIEKLAYLFFGFIVLFIIYHLYSIGGSPQIKAFSMDHVDDIARLRRSITSEAPVIPKYLSSFTIKAILPFMIFYFLLKDKKLFYYILLGFACFYSFSLMQKSFIVTILIPVFVFSIFQKRYLYSLKYVLLIFLTIFTMSFFANPDIKSDFVVGLQQDQPIKDVDEISDSHPTSYGSFMRIYKGLERRVLILPGQLVSEWFDIIPEKRPFLNGNGYRIIAKLKGEEFVFYPTLLAHDLRPEFIARGLSPSLNTASFMYEYSNFGKLGLVISGFVLALLFIFIESVFRNNFKTKISFNLSFVLFLSSTALTTTLFSGGWGLIIVLFLIFRKQISESIN